MEHLILPLPFTIQWHYESSNGFPAHIFSPSTLLSLFPDAPRLKPLLVSHRLSAALALNLDTMLHSRAEVFEPIAITMIGLAKGKLANGGIPIYLDDPSNLLPEETGRFR